MRWDDYFKTINKKKEKLPTWDEYFQSAPKAPPVYPTEALYNPRFKPKKSYKDEDFAPYAVEWKYSWTDPYDETRVDEQLRKLKNLPPLSVIQTYDFEDSEDRKRFKEGLPSKAYESKQLTEKAKKEAETFLKERERLFREALNKAYEDRSAWDRFWDKPPKYIHPEEYTPELPESLATWKGYLDELEAYKEKLESMTPEELAYKRAIGQEPKEPPKPNFELPYSWEDFERDLWEDFEKNPEKYLNLQTNERQRKEEDERKRRGFGELISALTGARDGKDLEPSRPTEQTRPGAFTKDSVQGRGLDGDIIQRKMEEKDNAIKQKEFNKREQELRRYYENIDNLNVSDTIKKELKTLIEDFSDEEKQQNARNYEWRSWNLLRELRRSDEGPIMKGLRTIQRIGAVAADIVSGGNVAGGVEQYETGSKSLSTIADIVGSLVALTFPMPGRDFTQMQAYSKAGEALQFLGRKAPSGKSLMETTIKGAEALNKGLSSEVAQRALGTMGTFAAKGAVESIRNEDNPVEAMQNIAASTLSAMVLGSVSPKIQDKIADGVFRAIEPITKSFMDKVGYEIPVKASAYTQDVLSQVVGSFGGTFTTYFLYEIAKQPFIPEKDRKSIEDMAKESLVMGLYSLSSDIMNGRISTDRAREMINTYRRTMDRMKLNEAELVAVVDYYVNSGEAQNMLQVAERLYQSSNPKSKERLEKLLERYEYERYRIQGAIHSKGIDEEAKARLIEYRDRMDAIRKGVADIPSESATQQFASTQSTRAQEARGEQRDIKLLGQGEGGSQTTSKPSVRAIEGEVKPQETSKIQRPTIDIDSEEVLKPDTDILDEVVETDVTSIERVNPNDIKVDPKRFQFKQDVDPKTGAGKGLDIEKWDENLAGVVIIWEDKNGDRYIVNGHHRLQKAKELGVDGLYARILREEDGISDKDARLIGAKVNIAEGHGSLVDAAKLFREGGYTLEQLKEEGLPLSSGNARKGYALAQLTDNLFDKVVTKQITENQGAIIGEMIPSDGGENDARQEYILKQLLNKDITNRVLVEMIDAIKSIDPESHVQQTLFGMEEVWDTATFDIKPKLIAETKRLISSDKNAFSKAIKSADTLKRAGNILKDEENVKQKDALEMALEFIDKGKFLKGDPISEIFDRLSQHIIAGASTKEVAKQAAKEIVKLITSGDYVNQVFGEEKQTEKQEEQIPGQLDMFSQPTQSPEATKTPSEGKPIEEAKEPIQDEIQEPEREGKEGEASEERIPQSESGADSTGLSQPPEASEQVGERRQDTRGEAQREIISTKTSTGVIYREGDYVYKPTTVTLNDGKTKQETKEAEVYEALKGVEGVADGEVVEKDGQKMIKVPYYDVIISTDDIPKEERHNATRTIRRNVERINKAVSALSNAGYSYSDPLQFGLKGGKMDLIDFSNANKPEDRYRDVIEENYTQLVMFYRDFGLDDIADIVAVGMGLRDLMNTYTKDMVDEGDVLLPENDRRLGILKELKRMSGDLQANNVYYSTNARMVQLKDIAQTEPIDGIKYVFSEKPLSEKDIDEWELKTIYEQKTEPVEPTGEQAPRYDITKSAKPEVKEDTTLKAGVMTYIDKRPSVLKGKKPDLTTTSKDYSHPRIDFYKSNNDLYIFMRTSVPKIEPSRWYKIENYKQHTALDVIRDVDLGRHFEDGIFKIWKEEGLDFGYVLTPTRHVSTSGETSSKVKSSTVKQSTIDEMVSTGKGKPMSKSEIEDMVRDMLDIPIGYKKFRQKAWGIYKTHGKVIRLKNPKDLDTLFHEVGHHLDNEMNFTKNMDNDEIYSLGLQASKDSYSRDEVIEEGFAEFIRLYITDRNLAREETPVFYEEFEKRIKEYSDFKDMLDVLSRAVENYVNQDPVERLLGNVKDRKVIGRQLTFSDLYRQLFDENIPIKKAVQTMTGGAKIDDSKDPYKIAWRRRGIAGRAENMIENGVMDEDYNKVYKSLKEVLEPVRNELRDFTAYAVAKRAEELHKRGIETGILETDIKETIKRYKDRGYDEVLKDLVNFQNAVLEQTLVREGIISNEVFAKMKELNKNYVPFYRVIENANTRKGGRNLLARQPIYRIKGSQRDIIDPISSIISNIYLFTDMANRNQIGKALVELYEKFPGSGKVMDKVPPNLIPQKVQLASIKRALMEAGANVDEMDLSSVATFFVSGRYGRKDNVITVYRDGKPEYYEIFDLDLYEALADVDYEKLNLLEKIASIPAKMLRTGATAFNPDFTIRNPIRDTFQAAITSESGFIPIIDTLRGSVEVFAKTELFKQLKEAGANQSSFATYDKQSLQKALKTFQDKNAPEKVASVITSPIRFLFAVSDMFEQGTRMGEARKAYNKAIREGLSHKEAIEKAALAYRDITLDFGRFGSSTKKPNKQIPFFNATLQGLDKTARTFKKDPVGATLRSLLWITMPSVILWWLNKDNERIQELPTWQKNTFWVFESGGIIWRVPKPPLLGQVFGSLPERLLDKAHQEDKYALENLLKDTLEDITPSVVPTYILPWLEVIANFDFFRKYGVVPKSEERLEPRHQYGEYTSEFAKVVGDKLNLSPRKIDHIITGYTGGLGKTILEFLDLVLGAEKVDVRRGIEKIPGIRGLVAREGRGGSVDIFYQELLELEARYASARRDDPKMNLNKFEEGKKLKEMRKAREKINKLYDEIAEIKQSNISNERKRQEIDRLNNEITDIARKAIGRRPLKGNR